MSTPAKHGFRAVENFLLIFPMFRSAKRSTISDNTPTLAGNLLPEGQPNLICRSAKSSRGSIAKKTAVFIDIPQFQFLI
ncbi:MAG: hypothetical protein JEZ10_03120 [Verrucomicrobia bacterium]|nr:hypothetical protein [Verrucomicrobiota bacterium]